MSCSKLGRTTLGIIVLVSLKHGGATKLRVPVITGLGYCFVIARNCYKNVAINTDKSVRLSCCLSACDNPRTTEWFFLVSVAVLRKLLNLIQSNEFPFRSGSSSSALHTELHCCCTHLAITYQLISWNYDWKISGGFSCQHKNSIAV